jgi:hypothetical protein
MKNLSVFAIALATLLGTRVSLSGAQDLGGAGDSENRDAYTVNLAFSKDGRTVREIRRVGGQFWRVRAISWDAFTGEKRHIIDLGPDTEFFSATTDGRIAVISENRNRSEEFIRLFLLDSETGQTQDIPSNWYDPENHLPDPAISGDGKLIWIHSDSGPDDAPRVVSVYDWQTRKLVAKQATGFSAGGFDGGNVTVDGKIEFSNNRNGTQIVDPKTGRSLVVYGTNSVRSPDGAWVVELAGYLHGAERLETIIINGLDGTILGKLDLNISDELNSSWSGVFCGTSGRFIAWNPDSVSAFDLISRKQIASLPTETWLDKNLSASSNLPALAVGCSWTGKRVAIRSGARFTLHDLE